MGFLPSFRRPSIILGSSQVLPFVGLPYWLGRKELKSHIHCIGLSGAGKSKLLASYASQLILQDQAVGLVDPHADLAHDVLGLLVKDGFFKREDARKKVLYVDFANREAALPFNVLRQPYPVEEVARLVVEACTRAWPALADGQAPQFENILLASVPVLVANDLPLTEMTRLLSDRGYREGLLRAVSDPQITSFWHDRFDQWGREAPLLVESALRRVFLLSYTPALRYALSQRENALNFRQLMDDQVSVIFNLGGLDEQTQKLLGCLVTVGYEVAALSRADMLEKDRTPYHLVLDEFASFSAQSEETLARVLSLTRKYGLFCTLAHQTFSQLSSRLAGALQNTLQICFRVGRDDALWAAPRFGKFDPHAIKHVVEDETAEPRTHPLFLSVQETYEGWAKAIEGLKPRWAFVRIKGRTVKIRTRTIRHTVGWDAIERLRASYATQLLTPRSQLGAAPEARGERVENDSTSMTATAAAPDAPDAGAAVPAKRSNKSNEHAAASRVVSLSSPLRMVKALAGVGWPTKAQKRADSPNPRKEGKEAVAAVVSGSRRSVASV